MTAAPGKALHQHGRPRGRSAWPRPQGRAGGCGRESEGHTSGNQRQSLIDAAHFSVESAFDGSDGQRLEPLDIVARQLPARRHRITLTLVAGLKPNFGAWARTASTT